MVARRFRSHLHLLLLCAGFAGCRTPEPLPPYRGPPVTAGVRYFAGGILLDSAAAGPSPLVDEFYPVTVRFIAVEDPPGDADGTLESEARLLADYVEESPLRPLAGITAGSRVAFGEAAAELRDALSSGDLGRTADAARLDGGLPSGVTAVFELAEKLPGAEDRSSPPAPDRRVEVHLHRRPRAPAAGRAEPAPGEEVRIALVVQGQIPGRQPGTPAAATAAAATGNALEEEPAGSVAAREFVLLDPLSGGEASLLAWVPSPFAGERPGSIVAIVEIQPSRRQGLISLIMENPALARSFTELAMHGTSPAPAAPRAGPAPLPGLASMLEALGSPFSQRLGILLLARETGAQLTEDLALSADEKLIAKLAASVRREILDGKVAPDRMRIGFVLESGSITTLLEEMTKERLAPGLQTVLLIHAGQAGAQAGSLEDVLRGADGIETLRERIIEENLLALEDSSPSARVRAFDWLTRRGRVPEGYDPLGSPRERRAALEKALQPVEATAQAPGGTPP